MGYDEPKKGTEKGVACCCSWRGPSKEASVQTPMGPLRSPDSQMKGERNDEKQRAGREESDCSDGMQRRTKRGQKTHSRRRSRLRAESSPLVTPWKGARLLTIQACARHQNLPEQHSPFETKMKLGCNATTSISGIRCYCNMALCYRPPQVRTQPTCGILHESHCCMYIASPRQISPSSCRA